VLYWLRGGGVVLADRLPPGRRQSSPQEWVHGVSDKSSSIGLGRMGLDLFLDLFLSLFLSLFLNNPHRQIHRATVLG